MKNFIVLLAFILISTVKAGTCTSISRTNSASLSVLTSSKYNSDLNTSYTFLNNYDAGCIAAGSLESDALNTTQFAPLLKGIHQGCKLLYSNASTVQIDKCLSSVNGNFIATTSATNASFGCAGCSSEVASTSYYVYIQTGSSGTTLTPLILTTAPNNDGYDNSGNKVIGSFRNNGSSNIEITSIKQWHDNEIGAHVDAVKAPGITGGNFNMFVARVAATGTVTEAAGQDWINGNCTNAAPSVCTLNTEILDSTSFCFCTAEAADNMCAIAATPTSSFISHKITGDSGGSNNGTVARTITCFSVRAF